MPWPEHAGVEEETGEKPGEHTGTAALVEFPGQVEDTLTLLLLLDPDPDPPVTAMQVPLASINMLREAQLSVAASLLVVLCRATAMLA